MASDITITKGGPRSSDLMVARVEGLTDDGVAYVDSYIPQREGATFHVHDSGLIVVHEDDVADIVAGCSARGLTTEMLEGV